MNRQETIEYCLNTIKRIAKEQGYNKIESSDREYGFWGEDFLSFLEKEYGKIPIFKIKNEKGEYVQIDNFWGNPKICWKKKDGSLATVSFREKESEYEFGESQIFYKAGFEMLNELLRGYI